MKKATIFFAVIISFFYIAVLAHAQYTPLAPLPIGEAGSTPGTYTLTSYLSGMLKLLIALGGGVAILTAIIGGTQYVAAGISPDAKSNAKERIQHSLIGLALVLSSYLILNTINPKLVEFNLMLPKVGEGTAVSSGSGSVPAETGATAGGQQAPLLRPSQNRTNNNTAQNTPLVLSPVPQREGGQAEPTQTITTGDVVATGGLRANVDATNDYSVVKHCLTSPSYELCSKADFNSDGKTDSGDFMLFASRGARLDLNGDKKLELEVRRTPVSCFFKKNTVSLPSILPRVETYYNNSDSSIYWVVSNSCTTGTGGIHPPTVSCNGQTWLKWSALRTTCADDMAFGFDPLSVGNYTKFQGWVTGATSGNRINLTSLFVRMFYDTAMYPNWVNDGDTGFKETILADVSYSTVAQYDLNNDGVADLNESSLDMTAFTACVGSAASGSCAQADFNNDSEVSNDDIWFRDLMMKDLFSQPSDVFMGDSSETTTSQGGIATAIYGKSFTFAPYHWFINWFESTFFNVPKYTDRQIVQYCVGHKPFEKCATADIDDSCLAQYRGCGTNFSCRASAESCKVDASDVATFDSRAKPFDINGDGIVNLGL